MGMPTSVVDEIALPDYRRQYLSPAPLYTRLEAGNVTLLVSAPPGVGKTHAAHGMIGHALKAGHDLVIYIAPTRALIAELLQSAAFNEFGGQSFVLERRPISRCGPLDPEWNVLEQSGCSALAKSTLCNACPHKADCQWPDQFEHITDETKLVICTETYLTINPSLIRRIVGATGAKHPLVIFDEASFMTANQQRSLAIADIERFRDAVTDTKARLGPEGRTLDDLILCLSHLLGGREDLASWPRISRFNIIGAVLDIQEAGRTRFGSAFRYIAGDLLQLTSGANAARWYAEDAYHFVPVPDTTGCCIIVFSPYLPPQIVEERLQRPVEIGLPPAVFRHSGTRVLNIADPVGALRTLKAPEHFARVADFVTALLLRDKAVGRRAVVVTKKRFVAPLRQHIESLSGALGHSVRCRTAQEMAEDPTLDADVILINYGILGVNSLKEHEALYCFGGYYARQAQLDETYNQLLPPEDQIDLSIQTEGGARKVVAGSADRRSRYHAGRAQAVLDMIERRIVLQAIGRVRPFTSPTTVLAFQQDDLSEALGEIEQFDRLSRARTALAVPTRAEMFRAALGDHLRSDRDDGMSYRAIAQKHDVPLSSVHRALAMPALSELLRAIKL